jgi:glucose-1-phosphate thymidylyltransferase
MKVLILAGGFGKRLLPLTENIPKPLIKINKKPIIEYILSKIFKLKNVDKIYLSINEKYWKHFFCWLKKYEEENGEKNIKLLNNGILNEKEKKGVLHDIKYYFPIMDDEDLLIIAGDNLFEFDLDKIIDLSNKTGKSVVAVKKIKKGNISELSCLEIDKEKNIIFFKEKPRKPKTNIVATGCYLLKNEDIKKIEKEKIKNFKNLGNIIDILKKEKRILGEEFKEFWMDIGSKEDLKIVEDYYS